MKSQNKIFFLFLLFSFQSCTEWMDLVPPEGLIREEFWKSKEDVSAVLMGAYDNFRIMDTSLFKYGELRADMIDGDINQHPDEQKIQEGNIYSDNFLCSWGQFYKVINYCNEIIVNAAAVQDKDDTFTDFLLQQYLSEAYYLRSLAYFYLVRIFKDVPLVLEPTTTDEADVYIPKSDGNEILVKITEDLVNNRQYASSNGFPTLAENKGRATRAAYDALLADIALWRFDYETCIKYIENIEVTREYTLLASQRWFEIFNPGNSAESIFEFQFDAGLNQSNGMANLSSRYSEYYDPSQKAIQLFEEDVYRGLDASIHKYGEDDFIIWKYMGANDEGMERSGTAYSSCNWIVYRYTDVMLMKAEALSQTGRYSEALEIINEVRSNAELGPKNIVNSATTYEDVILDERLRELAFEGKRWFDLLRMGRRNDYSRKNKLIDIIVSNVPSTQKRILKIKLDNPYGWYLPISSTELERNKNLIQNPYYNN